MQREEAEKQIRDLLVEVAKVVRDYGAPSGYLGASIYIKPDDGEGTYVTFNNEHWAGGEDSADGKPIDYFEFGINLVYDAANSIDRDQEKAVKDSPYDAIRPEDREAIAWVSEHGGVKHVSDIWDEMVNLCATIGCEPDIVTDAIEALGECTDIVNNRLMPPGMEWPRFEDGEQVKIGDMVELNAMVAKVCGVFISKRGYVLHGESGENTGSDARFDYPNFSRAKRPKQDPYGADGLPIHDDETVYLVDGNGDPLTVVCIETEGYQTVRVRKPTGYVINYDAQRLTHTWPAIGDDNLPFNVGDKAYFTDGREQQFNTVVRIGNDRDFGPFVQLGILNDAGYPTVTHGDCILPGALTHTKPEPPDSWEQIDKDSKENPFDYCKKVGHRLFTFDNAEEFKSSDLVRRAKALAERERAE